MELEVRAVRGMEGCFVSLPLVLIQTLEATFRSSSSSAPLLPPIVALELRSRDDVDRLWHVAWSGSASSSSAIEIAQQYAECIRLPVQTIVQVRAMPNIPKATLVTVEPLTEDDWEVLELNAEHAEAAILKQVGIVNESVRFPLWLRGKATITLLVVSIFPKKPIVQLVPGTEVAVAPKLRHRPTESHEGNSSKDLKKDSLKALLRVQDADNRFFCQCEVSGVVMDTSLTSTVFIHPETAKFYSLDSVQSVVIEPRFPPKGKEKSYEIDSSMSRSGSTLKDSGSKVLFNRQDVGKIVVCLSLSESVAKGHVMLSRYLRLYLRVGLRSWVHVKRCNSDMKKALSFSLSPCQFKMPGMKEAQENSGLEDFDSSSETKNLLLRANSETDAHVFDWSFHERVIAALSCDSPAPQDEETPTRDKHTNWLMRLVHSWILAQLDAIAHITGRGGVKSLVLGSNTMLHFKIKTEQIAKYGKLQMSSNGSVEVKNRTGELIDVLFVLSITEEPLTVGKTCAYEIPCEGNMEDDKLHSLYRFLGKVHLGEGISLYSLRERISDMCPSTTISSLNWMSTTLSDVTNRLIVLLSPASGAFLTAFNLPFPGHVLIYGPSGSGKTLLASAVVNSVAEHEDILAHSVFISCSRLALEKSTTIHHALSEYVYEALNHAPSVVILDDLDSIVPSSLDSEGFQSSSSSLSLTEFLTDILDEYEEVRKNSCGIGPIAFVACVQTLTSIPQTLTSSGRFDFHVQLSAPASAERTALLKHEIQKRSLQCSDEVLMDVASSCDGYDAYDLEILVDRSVHAATGRFLSSGLSFVGKKAPTLVLDDFSQGMKGFVPVSMRNITKSASDSGHGGWEDVGGLTDICNAIKEMIELPSKFPAIFSHAPLRLRANILLYGPPGCGKTRIVGAAAAACSLRFISVKGPELLNKYIGASEQAVRDIFSKAAAAAPCLLFFDEFDSIAPKRGHDNTGVTDRVVNQFLTELDGVEVLTGVFVFAATSRPDLLDAALLRPGRLDRLLFCDFPSQLERLDILTVLSRKLPLANDVDLEAIALVTEGFSGADLQALLSDAQLAAVHELLSSEDSSNHRSVPIITDSLLKSVASNARPSVSEAEKKRLYNIYSQFRDAKKSVGAQSRDAKGKRSTLA